jgi:hypothetical protein
LRPARPPPALQTPAKHSQGSPSHTRQTRAGDPQRRPHEKLTGTPKTDPLHTTKRASVSKNPPLAPPQTRTAALVCLKLPSAAVPSNPNGWIPSDLWAVARMVLQPTPRRPRWLLFSRVIDGQRWLSHQDGCAAPRPLRVQPPRKAPHAHQTYYGSIRCAKTTPKSSPSTRSSPPRACAREPVV